MRAGVQAAPGGHFDGGRDAKVGDCADEHDGPSSPGASRLFPQHGSLQQTAREDGATRVRSPRAAEVYAAAKLELSDGSPIKSKSFSHSNSSSRNSSPGNWRKAATSLGLVPAAQSSSFVAPTPTPVMHTLRSASDSSKHSEEDAQQMGQAAQFVQLQPHPVQGTGTPPMVGTVPAHSAATSPSMVAQLHGNRSFSAMLHPSQPPSNRDSGATESPSRMRLRTISAPSSMQLHTYAVQQATLQSQQLAGETHSPRVIRNNTRIPANYAQLNVAVTGPADANQPGLASPPASDGSVVSVYSNSGELPGASHSQTQPSRFRPKPPVPVPGSASNSASSTPSGGTLGSVVSTVSSTSTGGTVAGWTPHPPNSCRKINKQVSANAVLIGSAECCSPQVHPALPPLGSTRGAESPALSDAGGMGASTAFQRRGRSFVHHHAADWGTISSAGSLRSTPSAIRVKPPAVGADGTLPSPPGSARTPHSSSNGAFSSTMGRHSSGEYGDFGDLLTGSSNSLCGASSPYARGNPGAAVMLGSSSWQNGAFQGSSAGPLPTSRESSASVASPLGMSSSSSNAASGPSSLYRTSTSSSTGRCLDMVKKLVAAVRSRNNAQLETLLADYRSAGLTYGLSERGPTTDRTALHEAVNLGFSSMVQMLLAAGSDPNVGHPKEGPPLLQAAAVGAMDLVQLLLKYGAEIQSIDAQRLTALHHACRSGHVDCAHLLIRNGADLKAYTVDGETPLDLATKEMQIALCTAAAVTIAQDGPSGLVRTTSNQLQGASSGSFPGTPNSAREAQHISLFGPGSSSTASSNEAAVPAAATAAGTCAGVISDSGGLGPVGSLFGSERSMSSPSLLRRISSSGGGIRGASSCSGGLLSQVSSAAATPATAAPSISTSPHPAAPLSAGSMYQPPTSTGSNSSGPATAGSTSLSSPNSYPDPATAAANMRKPSPPSIGLREGSSGGGRPRTGAVSGPPSADPNAPPGDSSVKTPKDASQDDYNRCRTPPPLLNLPKDYQGRKGRFAQQQRQTNGSSTRQASAGLEDTQRGQRQDDQSSASVQHSMGSSCQQHMGANFLGSNPLQESAQAFRGLTVRDHGWQTSVSPSVASGQSAVQHMFSGGSLGSPPGGGFGSVFGSSSSSSAVSRVGTLGGDALAGLGRASAPIGFGNLYSQEFQPFSAPQAGSGINFGISQPQQQLQQQRPPHQPLQVQSLQQLQMQPQLSAPAALPVFKFGIDPNKTVDRMEAKAAAAAAAAAVAAKHRASPAPGNYNPLEHTFKLRSGYQQQSQQEEEEIKPRRNSFHMQRLTAVEDVLQLSNSTGSLGMTQQPGQQQQWQPGPSLDRDRGDARVPPLLHDISPVRSRSPASSPGAGSSSATAATALVTRLSAAPVHSSSGRDQQQRLPEQIEVQQDAVSTSSDGLSLSAARIFEHCTDETTGDMQWKCGGLLGEGAYGKVWMGLDLSTGNMMAVKELQLVGRRGSKEVENQLKELTQELSFYKKLKHPNIVGYIDSSFKTATNTLYIFLEYVPGGSIADMIKQFGPFPEDVAAKYTRQLLIGLQYLHTQQIVHRDLKGGNVLVTPTGVVKVADFGASKPFDDQQKTNMMKSLRGSAFWMAPEILKQSGYGRKADIWSLGCTVLEMLSGKHPWPDLDNQWSAMLAITQTETGPPRPTGISSLTDDFLDKCFKMDPKERCSAAELLLHAWVTPQQSNNARTRTGLQEAEAAFV